MNCVYKLETFQ
uniref:Uncharacterized protein n=1 Tax=Anguilla anguilla TaxID=7936 RepID=A0A0E9QTL0_ANGAN